MQGIFSGAVKFNQDIGDLDTSSVTDMHAMFNQAYRFNQDISGWCISKIPPEPAYFSDCRESRDNIGYNCNYNEPTKSSLIESHRPVWGTCAQ